MIEAPILRRPDMNLPFELHTECCRIGRGPDPDRQQREGVCDCVCFAKQQPD
jgi:hypothetical protein